MNSNYTAETEKTMCLDLKATPGDPCDWMTTYRSASIRKQAAGDYRVACHTCGYEGKAASWREAHGLLTSLTRCPPHCTA